MKHIILTVFILSIILHTISCNVKQVSEKSEILNSTQSLKDNCVKCDSIYASFPKNSTDFEKYFGYPNGIFYDGNENIQQLFVCLDTCYQYQELVKIIRLGTKIQYNADAPSHLQHFSTIFLMKNKKKTEFLYEELSCIDFENHIKFLFESIAPQDNFYPKLCTFLKELSIKDDCKIKTILSYCE
ncbi:MAG: hypothetical protein R2798_05760 [Chitinophagales bacterium]|nr:hypothetical protein [Chitinophagales bacterium]